MSAALPSAKPRIDQRQAKRDRRIDQGIASGQLTRREAHKLGRRQAAIDRVEGRAKAGGKVTTQERQHLLPMQDRASADIARQKHDRQCRAAAAASTGTSK